MTKFIIESLYKGYSIEDINELTQMGDVTVKEELTYLINGKLIGENNELTELGTQYGKILELFSNLSDGIDIWFNIFSGDFEVIDDEKIVNDSDPQYEIRSEFIKELSRNDNYANSLKIALKIIKEDTPFCSELKNSIYTTVKISDDEDHYKLVYIRNFDKGNVSEISPCIKLAIPWERITYRPRYRCVDSYREVIDQLLLLNDKTDDLISKKAKNLIRYIMDEYEAKTIISEINTSSGNIACTKKDLCELPDDKTIFVIDRQPAEIVLNDKCGDSIYLEETKREQLYVIRFYNYKQMED